MSSGRKKKRKKKMPYLDTLYACPFCGEEEDIDTEVVFTYDRSGNIIDGSNEYAVICKACKAQTGWQPSEKAALEAWNTRQRGWING